MVQQTIDVTAETDATSDAAPGADLDPETRARVDRARSVARLLDEAVEIPGTSFRVGIDPILGVAPVSGDALAAVGSLYVVYQGMQAGVPRAVIGRMLLSIAAEFVVGSVPLLGTLVDAGWKVNVTNVERIERHLAD